MRARISLLLFAFVVSTAAMADDARKLKRLPDVEITAAPAVRTINGQPLRIVVGDDTAYQVLNQQFPNGQIFPSGCVDNVADAGIFLSVAGTLFRPNFNEHSCGSAAVGFANSAAWTPVSISAVSGSGTAASPYFVTVVADAGNTGVRLTAVYSYVNGQNFFRISKTFCSSGTRDLNVYTGADIYLAGSDLGIPVLEPGSQAPGGRNCNNAGYLILLVPTTPAQRYLAASFGTVWGAISAQSDLPNSVGTSCVDNGAALQWRRAIAGGTCVTISSAVSFGTIPTIANFSVGSVNPNSGAAGQTLTVTVTGIGFQSGTTFSFGSGVTVNSTRIDSSTQATLSITIASNATAGARDVTGNQTANGPTSSSPGAFTVTAADSTGVPLNFIATPPTIPAGRSTTLSWSTDAAEVTIDNGIGTRPGRGSVTVSPTTTTTYRLTAVVNGRTATAEATVTVIATPHLVVSRFPTGIVHTTNATIATDYFLVTNTGGAAVTVTLTQNSEAYRQSPTSFTLLPGATQRVTITSNIIALGAHEGITTVSGGGATIQVPVRIGVIPESTGAVLVAESRRVETAGTEPVAVGEARFTNRGSGTLTGIVVSDVPWLIPQSSVITIPAGQTVAVRFTIDRRKRSDVAEQLGSLSGTLTLLYLATTPASRPGIAAASTTAANSVSIIDTVPPSTTAGTIPPLGPGEVALFIPGVGHAPSTVGTFASDLTLLHRAGRAATNRVTMYYTRADGGLAAQISSLPNLGRSSNVLLSNFVKNVFGGENQIGTLQIRASSIDDLSVASTVLNTTAPAGTYGSAIPVFRSDRAAVMGDTLVLPGMRGDAGFRTNVYIQETAGQPVNVRLRYFDANGTVVGTTAEVIGAFSLKRILNAIPATAVTAHLFHEAGSQGQFVAYATPVDGSSGDTWAIADWSRFYAGGGDRIIPIVGAARGANQSYFRTDTAIANRAGAPVTATLRYQPANGAPIDKTITLPSQTSVVYNDLVSSLFGVTSDGVGFVRTVGAAPGITVTSRIYTTAGGQPGTFGTAVPFLTGGDSLRAGQTRRIGGIEDSSSATIASGKPATYRTNLGLAETTGNPVKVKITLAFTFSSSERLVSSSMGELILDIPANGFLQLNRISTHLIPGDRESLGDLKNMELTVVVLDGEGAVSVFTSTIDNATQDSLLRTE